MAGFFLMLLLPCTIAIFGSRHSDEPAEDPFSSPREPERRAGRRLIARLTAWIASRLGPLQDHAPQAYDPPVPGRTSRSQNKLHREMTDIEALHTRAAALRTNAEALDFLARSAARKAAVAALEAAAAEAEVTQAVQSIRSVA